MKENPSALDECIRLAALLYFLNLLNFLYLPLQNGA